MACNIGHSMGLRWFIPAFAALAVGGCNSNMPWPGEPERPPVSGDGLTEVEELRAEVGMLKEQVEELRQRSGRLAKEVARVKFLNEQLHKQLHVVGDAPRQRDLYRTQLARRLLEIQRLEARVAELEGRSPPGSPPPTTGPKQADQ